MKTKKRVLKSNLKQMPVEKGPTLGVCQNQVNNQEIMRLPPLAKCEIIPTRRVKMERRLFLKNSVIGTSLVWLYGCTPKATSSNENPHRKLALSHQNTLIALLPSFLGSKLLGADGSQNFQGFLADFEKTISSLPNYTQKEVFLLLDLLGSRVTRFLLTGIWSPFSETPREELNSALVEWSHSSFGMRRNAYEGLRDLILGTWYANPIHWQKIGYPGIPIL